MKPSVSQLFPRAPEKLIGSGAAILSEIVLVKERFFDYNYLSVSKACIFA